MPEKNDFITIFKVEAEDHLTNLDKGLVELEKHPENLELVKELNREAHTLKGSSRILGYHEIQEIAHKIEDIFEKIGQKKLSFNSGFVDKIFKGLDSIRSVLEKIVNQEKIDVDISGICKELEECITVEVSDSKKSDEKEQPRVKNKQATSATAKKSKPKRPPRRAKSVEKVQDVKGVEKDEKKSIDSSPVPAPAFEEYIRIPVSRVNKLVNLIGEMVINRMKTSDKVARIKHLSKHAKETQQSLSFLGEKVKEQMPLEDGEIAKYLNQCCAQMNSIREDSLGLFDALSAEAFHLDPVINELQSRVKEIRLLSCSTIFEGFPRMVRDIASEEGKEVNLVISGEETELDKKILEGIKTPLMHILRNCIDHGIEDVDERQALGKSKAGTINLSACHEAGSVVITVKDDGRGMDLGEIKQTALKKRLISKEELDQMTDKEVLNLIFMNGYSTSPIITDISGRGIGLDIVMRDIRDLNGRVILDTEAGKGTQFTLILPLTIAIIQVLLIKQNEMLFALPVTSVIENRKVDMAEVSAIEGKMAVQVRDLTMPLIRLSEVLELPQTPDEEPEEKQEVSVVIAASFDKRVGFIVDEIISKEEVFIKNLGEHLGKIRNVSGATILGTGEVVVVLDVADLIANSSRSRSAITHRKPATQNKKEERRILIVEDAISSRELEKSILEAEGYTADTAIDGLDALDKITKAKYDLFVTDIQMPRMDGFEFCKTVKNNKEYQDIPVIMVTAMDKEEDKRRGIEAGAQAYIVKTTFDQSNLLETIDRLIG